MKKVTVKLYTLECHEDGVFKNLENYIKNLSKGDNSDGVFFDAAEKRYAYSIEDTTIDKHNGYIITCVKESGNMPIYFNDDGKMSDLPLPTDGAIGTAKYAFICLENRFMITDSDSLFKKLLNEFATDSTIKVTPVLRHNIEDIIFKNWDYYKKLSASLSFQSHDELAKFLTTKEGKLIGIVDELGGLKFDINISAPKQKQVLDADQLKSMVRSLLSNEFCTKLIVKGASFETECLEQYDLKKAQVIYSESFATDKIRIRDIIHAVQDGYDDMFKKYL